MIEIPGLLQIINFFKTLESNMKSVVTEEMKKLLAGRDAALVCGVTPRLWRLWNKMGYTPMPVKIGKLLFWKHQELDAWIEAGCPRREDWIYRDKKAKKL